MKICPSCGVEFDHPAWTCPACRFEPRVVDGTVVLSQAAAPENGYDARYYKALAELEAGNFWFRGRNALILWALKRFFPDLTYFAEIGCGTGYVLQAVAERFPGAQLLAGEIFLEALSFARYRVPRATYVVMDSRSIPFKNEFDVVGAFDVIEHIDEDAVALGQMHRALKPGGGLLLTVPQHRLLWSEADVAAHHRRRYSRKELIQKVTEAGFSVACVTSFTTLLFPAMLISRLARLRKGATTSQIDAELRLPSALDAVLGWAMAGEAAMIRAGASLPFGGSLLLAGRKKLA